MSTFADLSPSGFLVVPLPEIAAHRGYGGGAIPGSFYGGVDRRWLSDMEESLYEPGLPDNIERLYRSLYTPDVHSHLNLCCNGEIAQTLFAYCNRNALTHEIIAVRAPLLAREVGTLPSDGCTIEWLGFDVLAYGEWSLLNDGLFKSPDVFAVFVPHVNAHGLLATPEVAPAFTNAYAAAARVANIEPFHPPMVYDKHAAFGTAYTVEVGRVQFS